MSHEVNDQVLERLFEEVDSMSNGEIANELGQPWRVLTIRSNARESMIEVSWRTKAAGRILDEKFYKRSKGLSKRPNLRRRAKRLLWNRNDLTRQQIGSQRSRHIKS